MFAAERGDVFGLRRWYALTLAMGTFFVLGQAFEYYTLVTSHETTIASSAYGSVFYLATGFHGFHVIVGTIFLIVCLRRAYLGHFTPRQHFGFEAAASWEVALPPRPLHSTPNTTVSPQGPFRQ